MVGEVQGEKEGGNGGSHGQASFSDTCILTLSLPPPYSLPPSHPPSFPQFMMGPALFTAVDYLFSLPMFARFHRKPDVKECLINYYRKVGRAVGRDGGRAGKAGRAGRFGRAIGAHKRCVSCYIPELN